VQNFLAQKFLVVRKIRYIYSMKQHKNKCYAAGIADRQDNWIWQGTVVAPNLREAKKMVSEFRRKEGISGRSEVADFFAPYTSRKPKVYNSTVIY
jgi:hypothetical protein